ncbi:MAG: hypothetical protein MI974_31370 [Chitinophagales bacterium]|nr:hypothetical protein [Chitinophagales bacterium]
MTEEQLEKGNTIKEYLDRVNRIIDHLHQCKKDGKIAIGIDKEEFSLVAFLEVDCNIRFGSALEFGSNTNAKGDEKLVKLYRQFLVGVTDHYEKKKQELEAKFSQL